MAKPWARFIVLVMMAAMPCMLHGCIENEKLGCDKFAPAGSLTGCCNFDAECLVETTISTVGKCIPKAKCRLSSETCQVTGGNDQGNCCQGLVCQTLGPGDFRCQPGQKCAADYQPCQREKISECCNPAHECRYDDKQRSTICQPRTTGPVTVNPGCPANLGYNCHVKKKGEACVQHEYSECIPPLKCKVPEYKCG